MNLLIRKHKQSLYMGVEWWTAEEQDRLYRWKWYLPPTGLDVFEEMGEATNIKPKNAQMRETEGDLGLSVAPTVNNQA